MSHSPIHIAHSPDSDDAFMFYALARGKIDTRGFEFKHVLSDIETLNQKARDGIYEVSAISFHAYPWVAARYALLSSGSSMGDGYGPILIAKQPWSAEVIRNKKIAIPGRWTTAFLALRIYEPQVQVEVMPFHEILPAVARGQIDLGLIIHEGQLTYLQEGVHKVLDLGAWWKERTQGLPLPLGGNVIRRDLGEENCRTISQILREGICYGLEHRQEALAYALEFARGLDQRLADRFVGMYVNELTVDYGERGRAALRRLFTEAFDRQLIPEIPPLEFV